MKTLKELAIQDTLEEMQDKGINILDNPFRLGSTMFFETINEARKLHLESRYRLTEVDKNILETDIGNFDVYEGENIPKDKKSVAINVTLQSLNKTLSEKDLDQISKKIIDVVKEKTGATIRS